MLTQLLYQNITDSEDVKTDFTCVQRERRKKTQHYKHTRQILWTSSRLAESASNLTSFSQFFLKWSCDSKVVKMMEGAQEIKTQNVSSVLPNY